MQFVLMVIGLIGAVGVWYWRLRMARDAAMAVKRGADTVANLPRKLKFQSRSRKGAVQTLTDPREAAACLLAQMARAGGAITRDDKQHIAEQMARHFEVSFRDAEELMEAGLWLTKDFANYDTRLDDLIGLIKREAGADALADTAQMLDAIASEGGGPSAEQGMMMMAFLSRSGLSR